jgi:hypothetical protein
MYAIYSPDGFTITIDNFNTKKEAKEQFNIWLQRYERQGYYSSARYGRIPLDEVESYCELVKL